MSLVDRINIHFKIGNFIDVKFSEDEKSIVKGVESVETFEDVVHWSKILWDYCQNARHQEKIKEGGEQLYETKTKNLHPILRILVLLFLIPLVVLVIPPL